MGSYSTDCNNYINKAICATKERTRKSKHFSSLYFPFFSQKVGERYIKLLLFALLLLFLTDIVEYKHEIHTGSSLSVRQNVMFILNLLGRKTVCFFLPVF